MNEKQKLELNWPDNISYEKDTYWESTIIQNKLIVFTSFYYDSSPANPCKEWDGFGEIRSLSTRHINSITTSEIESLLDIDPANKEQIIPLSYFEHGNCKWGVRGTMSSMPDFNWDGVEFAGVWIPDKECIDSVKIEEMQAKEKGIEFDRNKRFKEMAEQACEIYTAWANGEVYGFMVEIYRLQLDENKEPIEDYDDYENLDVLWEDSCWGYYGYSEFNDHMKNTIQDAVQHHVNSIKSESKFDLDGEPDYSKMSQDDFTRILITILSNQPASQLISISGIYEILSEHYHNEILDEWAKEQLK